MKLYWQSPLIFRRGGLFLKIRNTRIRLIPWGDL